MQCWCCCGLQAEFSVALVVALAVSASKRIDTLFSLTHCKSDRAKSSLSHDRFSTMYAGCEQEDREPRTESGWITGGATSRATARHQVSEGIHHAAAHSAQPHELLPRACVAARLVCRRLPAATSFASQPSCQLWDALTRSARCVRFLLGASSDSVPALFASALFAFSLPCSAACCLLHFGARLDTRTGSIASLRLLLALDHRLIQRVSRLVAQPVSKNPRTCVSSSIDPLVHST